MDSASLDLVLGKIVSILENEFLLLSGVRDGMEAIRDELGSMRSFLEGAESKGKLTSGEKDWVSIVRDMACQVEIVVEEYMYLLNKQRQWRGKFTRFFLNCIQFPQNLWFKHKVAVKLQDVNQRIRSIPERNRRYGLLQLEGKDGKIGERMPNWLKIHNESARFFKGDDLVGNKREQNQLLKWLKNVELQRSVISVVGLDGLGKTTLVANTFNKVKQDFDCCAWVTVSQQYVAQELCKSMIRKLNKEGKEETSNMDYGDLVGTLVNFLKTKRYLIVLDDVWSDELWKGINVAFPANMKGSRILITTRNQDVASSKFGDVNHVLSLKPLPFPDSWKLFCMKAFPSKVGQCPPYLHSQQEIWSQNVKAYP